MNVVVTNEKQNDLLSLDVDIIKTLTGVYSVKEIVDTFKSFFYSKMILDVTAIKEFKDIDTYELLSKELGADKLVLLLPEGSSLCTPNFLSHLIELGIYNFTTNLKGVNYLLNKPNTLKEVEHILKMGNKKESSVNEEKKVSKETNNKEEIVKQENEVENTVVINTSVGNETKVIGFKNVTEHAGATTLVYMLKKELNNIYGHDNVVAIEVNKNDFIYFNEKNMFSTKDVEIKTIINNNSKAKVILVDLNNCQDDSFCGEVIYLIEPSTIRLNKLIQRNKAIFTTLVNKKIILNQSLLSNGDVGDFENEARVKIFYNMPPLDERKKNDILNDFLIRLGLCKPTSSGGSNKIFGLFRR